MISDSARTKKRMERSLKPMALRTASSPMRSRTEMAMVLPVTSSRVKKTTVPMVRIRNSMLPNCLTEASGKGGFGFGFGFIGGVGEHVVDGLGDTHGVVGTVELQDVPADVALDDGRDALVEVFPLEPELSFVATARSVVVNAVEIEFPGLRRP